MAIEYGTSTDPIFRRAARVLLVNAEQRVLLFRSFDPAAPGDYHWVTVGGGLDHGETPAQAAARELREETGLDVPVDALGQPVWHDETTFTFAGRWYRQRQAFFLLQVAEWMVDYSGFDQIEREVIDTHRWWSLDELDGAVEPFYPVELAQLLRTLVGTGRVHPPGPEVRG